MTTRQGRLKGAVLIAPAIFVAGLLAFSGCQTDQQFLDKVQPAAVNTAVTRAQFELGCQEVTSSILSRKVIEPPMVAGPRGGFVGEERAEYTIGVEGCGKKSVYVTVCPDANNCNALAQTARVVQG